MIELLTGGAGIVTGMIFILFGAFLRARAHKPKPVRHQHSFGPWVDDRYGTQTQRCEDTTCNLKIERYI